MWSTEGLDSRSVRDRARRDVFLPEKRKVDSSILSLTTTTSISIWQPCYQVKRKLTPRLAEIVR